MVGNRTLDAQPLRSEAVKTERSTLIGAKRVHLATTTWRPNGGKIKADIVLVHGYGEHSERYEAVAEHLTGAGYRVCTMDLRGHGRSTGVPRGVVDDFELVVDDVARLIERVRSDRPLFVYGHSMGGLVAARLAERDEVELAGAIIASPLMAAAESIPAPLVKVANVLGRLAPRLPTITLDDSAISRVPEVVADYDTDPLNYRGKITAGTGMQMNVAMKAALAEAGAIRCPVLIMHGTADQLTAPSGSQDLAKRVGSTDVTLKMWDGAYHELHHEPERLEVLALMTEWLDAHV